MNKEERITKEVKALHKAIADMISSHPSPDALLVKELGTRLANVESILHWDFNCWELATPEF